MRVSITVLKCLTYFKKPLDRRAKEPRFFATEKIVMFHFMQVSVKDRSRLKNFNLTVLLFVNKRAKAGSTVQKKIVLCCLIK